MQWSVCLFCLQLLLGLGRWDFLLIYPRCSQSSHRNEHNEPLHWFFSLKIAPILCTHPLRTLLPVLGWENRSASTVHPPLGAMQEGMWDFPGVPVGNFRLGVHSVLSAQVQQNVLLGSFPSWASVQPFCPEVRERRDCSPAVFHLTQWDTGAESLRNKRMLL